MDLIERLFGWSPDAGDGTLELMLLVALAVAVAVFVACGRVILRHARRAED